MAIDKQNNKHPDWRVLDAHIPDAFKQSQIRKTLFPVVVLGGQEIGTINSHGDIVMKGAFTIKKEDIPHILPQHNAKLAHSVALEPIHLNEEELRGWEMKMATNLINDMMQEFTRTTIRQWEEKLKVYLQDNLRRIGVTFANEAEFLHICQFHIKRVSYQDKPNYYEFYYGGIGMENIYLGAYSDHFETTQEGSTVTITISKDLK